MYHDARFRECEIIELGKPLLEMINEYRRFVRTRHAKWPNKKLRSKEDAIQMESGMKSDSHGGDYEDYCKIQGC